MFFVPSYSRKSFYGVCKVCGEEKVLASVLGICKDCIVERFEDSKEYIHDAHRSVRKEFNLPMPAPSGAGKIVCRICSHECVLDGGKISFCGLRWEKGGKLFSISDPNRAPVYSYLDPHITNCCASWFCPAATGIGYPKFSVRPGVERGYYNLAIFFYGCNFSCLFCQNWEHKNISEARYKTARELANEALYNPKVTCICYFGGDPDVHLPYTINVNRIILEEKGDRVIRICYEWNGDGNSFLVRKAAEQVYVSGGIIKFDLKAPNEKLYFALTGVKPKNVWKNFEMIYNEFWEGRKEVPILTATTLLVPGYIGPEEVEEIAKKIAEIDPNIPYSLLVFHPDFKMLDLPITPKKVAREALNRAKKYLKKVHLGNIHLLSWAPDTL